MWLAHFNRLKADLQGGMRATTEFLDIDLPGSKRPMAVEHCTFEYIEADAELSAPVGGFPWEGGGDNFIDMASMAADSTC